MDSSRRSQNRRMSSRPPFPHPCGLTRPKPQEWSRSSAQESYPSRVQRGQSRSALHRNSRPLSLEEGLGASPRAGGLPSISRESFDQVEPSPPQGHLLCPPLVPSLTLKTRRGTAGFGMKAGRGTQVACLFISFPHPTSLSSHRTRKGGGATPGG